MSHLRLPAGVRTEEITTARLTTHVPEIPDRPDVLWIRGDADQIVSDASLVDLGHLGALGAVPGWPGADVFPAQPMVTQMRALLDRYRASGGRYTEHVLACGHSPHLERPAEFRSLVAGLVA